MGKLWRAVCPLIAFVPATPVGSRDWRGRGVATRNARAAGGPGKREWPGPGTGGGGDARSLAVGGLLPASCICSLVLPCLLGRGKVG